MHSHSRRNFLTSTLGAGWLGTSLLQQASLRAAEARALAPAQDGSPFEIEKVADGIWAAVAKPAAAINCNAAIFEQADGLLVVDSHSKPAAAAALVAQIRREMGPKPVRYLVNTHFHADHVLGNPAYKKIAPQVEIISSTATRDLIAQRTVPMVKMFSGEMEKSIETRRKALEAAKTAEEKAYHQRMLDETHAFVAEMRSSTVELPTLTFDGNLILHGKAHDLHLAFRGRAHTAGDIVVYCPQKKVLASGDLLHGFLPFIGDGYPRDWPGTLRAIGAFDFTAVIGGHGAVQHGRDRLGQMSGYIEELTAAVDAGKRAGRPLEELQKSITPATLKSLATGYGDYVAKETLSYYEAAHSFTAAQVLAEGVKGNVADVLKTLDKV